MPPCSEGFGRLKGELGVWLPGFVVVPAFPNKLGVEVAPKRPPPDGWVVDPNMPPGVVEPVVPMGFAGQRVGQCLNELEEHRTA